MTTDDEITAAAIEQALREVPEPTREQAHDAVCAAIRALATSHWGHCHVPDCIDVGIHDDDALTDIRRLEHATRLLRAQERAITALRERFLDFQDTHPERVKEPD